jgi:hypothetical protein
MGLFDAQTQKLGERLAKGFDDRVIEIQKDLETEKDPGRSLLLKTTLASLKEVALVIRNSLKSE